MTMITAGKKHYFERRDDKFSEFWEIEVFGPVVTVRQGKIGTAGKEPSRAFDNTAAALAQARQLVIGLL
jgi:predicted DNA-binding WGR domain protein